MPFTNNAQYLQVVEPEPTLVVLDDSSMIPLELENHEEHNHEYHEEHEEHNHPHELEVVEDSLDVNDTDQVLEVVEPAFEIVLDEIPGAPQGSSDVLEVIDEEPEEEEVIPEEDPKAKKNEKWDLSGKGPEEFINWIKERISSVPRHSGEDTAGLERAIAYLERLDNEISKAMRLDLDGELDASKVEESRVKIDDGISRIFNKLEKIKKFKKSKRKKTASLVKEGQKIAGVQGIVVTVPLLISRIARVCINGMVSGGHDIEDLFHRQAEKYDLTVREKAEVITLLGDMGFPMRMDRGYLEDEEVDARSSDNFDWSASYQN